MKRLFIDVREPEEYAAGHIPGALNFPPSQLLDDIQKLNIPKDTELILYCRTGSRSRTAINLLEPLGYTNLVNGINMDQVEQRYGTDSDEN